MSEEVAALVAQIGDALAPILDGKPTKLVIEALALAFQIGLQQHAHDDLSRFRVTSAYARLILWDPADE